MKPLMVSSTLCRLTAVGLGLGVGGAAQAASTSLFELDLEKLAEVVVTDTKIAQRRDTVTQKLESIVAEEFELRTTPQRNLAEILRYTAGQFVNPLSRNDANWGSYAGLGPKSCTMASVTAMIAFNGLRTSWATPDAIWLKI